MPQNHGTPQRTYQVLGQATLFRLTNCLMCYDDISVQSVDENQFEPTTSTSDPTQRFTDDMEMVQSTEPSKWRKLDMGDFMVRTNVTK